MQPQSGQGTGWITNGATISATSLKENLDYLKEQVSTSGVWLKNGASTYYSSGNVGIGTTGPSNKLEVAGKIEADEYCDRDGDNCVTATEMGGSSIVITSRYGSGRRCAGDAWISACHYRPGYPWNYNTCYSRGHAVTYGWSIVWDPSVAGYKISSGPNPNSPVDITCDI